MWVHITQAVYLWLLEIRRIEQFRSMRSQGMCHVFAPTLYVVCLEWYVKARRFSCKSFASGAVSRSHSSVYNFQFLLTSSYVRPRVGKIP
jgi:hypothetical protein